MTRASAARALNAHWPWGLAALFAAALSYLKLRQHFSLQSQAYDLGIYANMLWNTLHGRPFWIFFAQAHYLGDHFAPLVVLLAPLLWLWENAGVLLIFQSLAVSLTIPAAARLARVITGEKWLVFVFPLWWTLSPYLHNVSRYDFHEMAVVMPTLLWGILFWESKKYRAFWILAGTSFLWREDVGLLWAGFAAAAWLRAASAREKKQAVILAAAGLLYAAAAVTLAIPKFGNWRFVATVYAGLGSNPGEIASTILRPDKLWLQTLGQPAKAAGLGKLILTTGGLPFLAPSTWPAWLVPAAINTLSDRPWQFRFDMHYAAGSLPFLSWAMLHGWRKLSGWIPAKWRTLAPWLWVPPLLLAAAWWKPYFTPVAPDRPIAIKEMVARIPRTEAVVASSNLLPHLAFRREIYLAPDMAPVRWVVLDAAPVGFTPPPEYLQWMEGFQRQFQNRMVWEKAGLRLYDASVDSPGK